MAYEKERKIAIEAVKSAMIICQAVRSNYRADDARNKADHSPVTVADYASQAAIVNALSQAFPHDPIVGEEDAAELRQSENKALLDRISELLAIESLQVCDLIDRGNYAGGTAGRFWTLDPIDGTKGFIRGDQYAVALALIENGIVVLGVLGCPNLDAVDGSSSAEGRLFAAVRGEGSVEIDAANLAEGSIAVQLHRDFSAANFCESMESGHSSHGHSEQIAQRLGITAPPFRIDSQCKYAAVARGQATIYLRLPTRGDYVEKIWDHAAGMLVVAEAGGQVSDVYGRPLDFSCGRRLETNKGVIVTNRLLHDETISAVKETLNLENETP